MTKQKRKKSNPGDIIKTRNGIYAVVGEYGSLMTSGVFVLNTEGPQKNPSKQKLSTDEKRALR